MGNTERQAIIPHKQALVPFYSGEILGAHLPDDHLAAGINSMCGLIGLSPHGQVERIRRDKTLSAQLVLVLIETPSRGAQRMDFLMVEAIPFWLMGLEISMIAPEKRSLILALQFEAAGVLYRYFFGADAKQASRPAVEEPATPQGQRPATRARPQRSYASSWEQFPDALVGMRDSLDVVIEVARNMVEEQRQLEAQVRAQEARHTADQAQVQLRLARLEQGYQPEAVTREAPPLGQGILSPEHVGHLVVLARALRASTGEPIKAIYAELEDVFGVEDFSDIPDAGWDVVQEWFLRQSQEA